MNKKEAWNIIKRSIYGASDNDIIDEAMDVMDKMVEESLEWIPVTARPITEEEKEYYEETFGDDITHIFDCPLPDDGDEILISTCGGKYVMATEFSNCGYGVGDERGNDWLYEVDAWMPMPKPYRKENMDIQDAW